jgi:hypothetical protein
MSEHRENDSEAEEKGQGSDHEGASDKEAPHGHRDRVLEHGSN